MDGSPAAELSASAADAAIDLRSPVHELVRCALRAAHNGGAADGTDHDTHGAVQSLCDMARANDVRAETVILAVKAGWRQLPDLHGMSRMDAEAALAELITRCIKEYYAPQRRP
jgi:hypothetical protein